MKNKIIKYGSFLIGVIIFISILIFNVSTNSSEFFKTSVIPVLNLFIVIGVSYYLVQHRTDERSRNNKIDKILYKIQDIILNNDFIKYNTEDERRKTLLNFRTLSNKVVLISDNCKNKTIDENIDKIYKEIESFREFFSNHMNDENYLKSSEKEIMDYITKIDDECEKIHMKLY